jgi:gamma-glutamyl-gamma-aminobutyrate hydrolase PuuD
MKILISCRSHYDDYYREDRDCVDQKLIEWVIFIGFEPVIVPNIFGNKKYSKKLKNYVTNLNAAGLVLSGGENFGVNKNRDSLENYLLKYFLKKKKPILGICRGFQFISKKFGSKIVKAQEIIKKKYQIQVSDKFSKQTLKSKCYFNFTIDKIPNNFYLVACNSLVNFSPWIIKSKKFSCECWLMHPERDKSFNPILSKRARNLFLKK